MSTQAPRSETAARGLFDLTGKVALITGSTRGIGLGIAKQFAAHGARVVVSSRKPDACEAARGAIVEAGGEAIAVPCNIGQKDQLQALVERTLAEWGQIDVLVCNAAVNPYFGPMSGISDEAFDKILGSNVRSNLWLCNMVLPQMAKSGGGSVILLSSIAGLKGTKLLGAYGISKAADSQLARNLAVEWGSKNVRANCIAPGIIRTDFAKALYENPKAYEMVLKTYPLGRLGEVEDVAGVAVMLASDAGAFITGQTIVVDGGTTVGGFE
jgi:NAD(P)-dependent dehydrogenase (short-subunit alcohol dehydrogenase family)